MPYLEGATLSKTMATSGPLAVPHGLWIARQIAEALGALHVNCWIHGDLKPENIFLSPGGHATLLDLGFARRLEEPGNIIDESVRGCAPRNKLKIAEFDDENIALVRDTVTIIDESPRGKGERNFSNFVLYEDRISKDLVVLMTPGFIGGEWMKEGDIDVINGYRYDINV